jgi:hypothetical protein
MALPFETIVFGSAVIVERIDLTERDDIVAICRRGRESRKIRLVDLPLPSPPPDGAQWIAAYRHWLREGASVDSETDFRDGKSESCTMLPASFLNNSGFFRPVTADR